MPQPTRTYRTLPNCTRRVSETGAQDKPKPGDPYLDTTCLSHPCLNTPSNALCSLSRVRALSVPSLNSTWPCLTHPGLPSLSNCRHGIPDAAAHDKAEQNKPGLSGPNQATTSQAKLASQIAATAFLTRRPMTQRNTPEPDPAHHNRTGRAVRDRST